MTERWTLLVVRHRRLVVACWLGVLAAGVAALVLLPARLENSFAVPGTDSQRAQDTLARAFGERPEGTFTVVFHAHRVTRAQIVRAARVLPHAHVRRLFTSGGVSYAEIATTLPLQTAKGYTERIRRALPAALVTGEPAVQHDLDPLLARDLRRGDAIALPLALLVLLAVLGVSLAVAVPFVVAACTIAGALAAVYVAALFLPITPYATNLVALLGLGLGVDYSLLVVSRFRDELARDDDVERAIVRTTTSAGRAAVFSGIAVSIGLALLLFVPVPFIRTLGVAGLLLPLVAIAAATTLQPALLALLGRRVARAPRLALPWARLARSVMRRPYAIVFTAAAVLVLAAVPLRSLELTPGSFASLPSSLESVRGIQLLRSGFGAGALTPTQIVVTGNAHAATRRLTNALFHDREVYVVASGAHAPYVSGDVSRVFVVGRHEYGDPRSRALVARIRDRYIPAARFPAATDIAVGGPPAQGADFLRRAYAPFAWLVAAALLLTYVVLARAFRSLLLPLKAVLLNVLSVAASFGVLVFVVRHGLLGLDRSAQVDGWVPLVVLATLFGVSMDYEVFMVSRMREAWDERGDNAFAVARGLERTGAVVTAAALVMVVAFSGFVAGSIPALQQLGVALAVAVLIDATLVRVLLVPALMAILGRWNWWLPTRLRPERHGPGGPAGLQNQCGVVAPRSVGSTPAPLRLPSRSSG
jgi:putative drug exporter of the RND superfamily